MFGPFMKDEIGVNMKGNLIITYECEWLLQIAIL